MRHLRQQHARMLSILIFYSLNPTAIFLRAVSDAINQPGGSGVVARAPQRSENERDGETEWHGEEEGSGGED